MIDRGILFFLLLILAGFDSLAASAPTLRANVNELAPRARDNAPEWIEVTLSSRSTGIREGVLEFTMIEWGGRLCSYRTHDLVLNSGDQRFRFMLPAVSRKGENSNRSVQLRFIEKEGVTTSLGEFPLSTRQSQGTAHVIAVIRPNFRAGAATYPIWQALRLEHFAPNDGPKFDTTPVFLDPAEVPADPLGFFPFNLVLIEPDAFGKMREKARAALSQWVNAGGSLCIMTDGRLEPEQVEAINQLAEVDPQWKPLTFDEPGRVKVPGNMVFARVNFGRMAVVSEFPPENAEQVPPLWREAAAFLWRLNSDQARLVTETGEWDLKQNKGEAGTKSSRDPKAQRKQQRQYVFLSEWRRFETPIWEVFPSTVRVIPLWMLAMVIVIFLILVGPGDWFILGALRRHRLTWILFPSIAVLVTAGTVFLVQWFMGTSRRACSVVISDIGMNGRVMRETRIELELPASQETATTPVRNALRLPAFFGPSYSRQFAQEEVLYQGQYPARFDYIRQQRQWAPELSRITSITDAADTSGIKWDAFTPELFAKHKKSFQPIEATDRAIDQQFDLIAEGAAGFNDGRKKALSFFTKWGTRNVRNNPATIYWRYGITLALPYHENVLITQVSPSGFPSNEDLRILEPNDPSRTVVAAAVREGDIIHVWRRLYLH